MLANVTHMRGGRSGPAHAHFYQEQFLLVFDN
jgi:hypothetical protein